MGREFGKIGSLGERGMPIFGPEDFAGAGNGAGNMLKGLAGAVADSACSLYQAYPRSFTGGLAGDSPVGNFNRGLWDNLCGSLPVPKLPAPPSRPFTGGQCDCVAYLVTYTYTVTRRTGEEPETQQSQVVVFGPVGGFSQTQTPDGFNSAGEPIFSITIMLNSRGTVFFGCQPKAAYPLVTVSGLSASASVLSVVKNDGSSDDCGSLDPDWPDAVAPPSNPGTYNYQPDDGGPPVPIDFDINFDPTINGPLVRLPDVPNVCLNFELYGVNVDLCTNKPSEGGGTPDLGPIEDKLNELGDKLDDIGEGVDEGTNDEPRSEGQPEPLEGENGEPLNSISKCVENLRYVRVLLTKIPKNANLEKGLGAKDLVDEAGWISFLVNGSYLPPQRIYFDNSLFEAPEGTDCYAMKLNLGFEASVSHIVKVVE